MSTMGNRQLGTSDLQVSSIGFGCWPISGVSTLEVTDAESTATLHAALDAGINFFDTAFSYGYSGEADRLLAPVVQSRRDELVLASKVGMSFDARRERVVDGRPATLLEHAAICLQRLGVECLDVMYLHVVDPDVPIAESAGAIKEIIQRGWARYAGVSNVDSHELAAFHAECPVVVVQPPFNMLQQASLRELRETCEADQISIANYWALMKGLLTGKFTRDHQFDPRDKRLTYSIYQGESWQRSQDFLDGLRLIASEVECTVSQLVLAWTVRQPGIVSALCGAKRPDQIRETAAAMSLELTSSTLEHIDALIASTDIGE